MDEELKTCPFCGNDADLVEIDDQYSIICRTEGCFLSIYIEDYGSAFTFPNVDLLVEAWNHRIEDEPKPFSGARRLIYME